MLRRIVLLAVAATLALTFVTDTSGKKKDPALSHRVVDVWSDTSHESAHLKRLLIIGITDNLETRKHFENKFVSHLRGYAIDGVTSYSLVTDLTAVEDETEIVQAIEAQQIDGAISVRVVAMKGTNEEAWASAWRQAVEVDGDLREMIDESLPVSQLRSKEWGVEVALWDTSDWDRIWAGRTNLYTRKQLEKGAGAFVQDVIQKLKGAELL